MKLNLYEKIMGYTMAWAEDALDKHPFLSALVTALIIDQLIW